MKFQERTSTKKSEAGMTGWNVLTLGSNSPARNSPRRFTSYLEPDCLQDAKGLIPREGVIVRLDPAKYQGELNIIVKYPKLSL
jgi:hypothetical protein